MKSVDDSLPVYRCADFADLMQISAIESDAFEEPYTYTMLRQLHDFHGEDWLVAVLDGSIVGYVLTIRASGRALIFSGAVSKEFRNRGYYSELVNRTLQRNRERGVQTFVTARPDNIWAVNSYKRAGFSFVERDDRYFGLGEVRDIFEDRSLV